MEIGSHKIDVFVLYAPAFRVNIGLMTVF